MMNRIVKWILWVLIMAFLAFYPRLFGIYFTNVFVTFAIFALFAVSYNLLLGFTGLFSFGHAMFFGTGGYATALALTHIEGCPLLVALLMGPLFSILLALLLLPGLLPPVWGHPRELFTREFRLQGLAVLLGILLVAAHGLFRRLSPPALGVSLSALALVGLVPVQGAFWAIRSRIWAAYNTPTIRLGWGLWLNIVAWLALLGAAALLFHRYREK